jgi:transcriptional/translational regulatory protein YebC/TACO1
VAWNFQRKGSITVKPGPSEDRVMEAALEAGADDVCPRAEVECGPIRRSSTRSRARWRSRPRLGEQRWIYLLEHGEGGGRGSEEGGQAARLLEDNDDVQNVWANADIPGRTGADGA